MRGNFCREEFGRVILLALFLNSQDCYTRVLKGHIDIANAVFPNDTYGKKITDFLYNFIRGNSQSF